MCSSLYALDYTCTNMHAHLNQIQILFILARDQHEDGLSTADTPIFIVRLPRRYLNEITIPLTKVVSAIDINLIKY